MAQCRLDAGADTGHDDFLKFLRGIIRCSGYATADGKQRTRASRGARRMGFCTEDCHSEIVEMLKRFELPYETDIPPEKLIEAAFSDKKRSGGRITEVLPEKIGKCVLHSFSLDELEKFIWTSQ